MLTERELAELIFDTFRKSNLKANEIVMMQSIGFDLIKKLNPKEQEIIFTVLNGLIFTGFITYQKDNPQCIRLTEKGYDYIYDDDKIEIMQQKPWIIPDKYNTNWDKAYSKLWKVIGSQDSSFHYIGGGQFYKLVFELSDDIPVSYTNYIEQRRKKNLSTSRIDYYRDLIDLLDEEKRFQLYVNIQLFIEKMDEADNKEGAEDIMEAMRLQGIVDNWAPSTLDEKQQVSDDTFDLKSTCNTPNYGAIQNKKNLNETETDVSTEAPPIVFISYSWDNKNHEDWVLDLAKKLCDNGIDVILDKWELNKLGQLIPNFMEQSISKSQRVICVMTPNYKKKTEKLTGGVGYEYSIITAEVLSNNINTTKFIPLIREGDEKDTIPVALRGRKHVDMRSNEDIEELLRDIHDEPKHKKPTIGKKPKFD